MSAESVLALIKEQDTRNEYNYYHRTPRRFREIYRMSLIDLKRDLRAELVKYSSLINSEHVNNQVDSWFEQYWYGIVEEMESRSADDNMGLVYSEMFVYHLMHSIGLQDYLLNKKQLVDVLRNVTRDFFTQLIDELIIYHRMDADKLTKIQVLRNLVDMPYSHIVRD